MTEARRQDQSREITAKIASQGSVTVSEYMSLCLNAYYQTRDPLGADGDFVTAPEISQVFGELLGLWSVEMWSQMGAPSDFHLIELGPGRGTLMNDALRASKAAPDFLDSTTIHLVDINPVLRDMQKAALAAYDISVIWHDDISSLPDGPAVILANEFFDALPVTQAVHLDGAWRERQIKADESGALLTALSNTQLEAAIASEIGLFADLDGGHDNGAVFEYRSHCKQILKELGKRLHEFPTAMLIIDYGHEESGTSDTLQAVAGHQYADPLQSPGQADLTTQVDFNQLKTFAEQSGFIAHRPMTMGHFLLKLGLETRLNHLVEATPEDQRSVLVNGVNRLVSPHHMGVLFKTLALTSPGLRKPPPF